MSDLELLSINPSRQGWAGSPSYCHAEHRQRSCLPIWDRGGEQTGSTGSSHTESGLVWTRCVTSDDGREEMNVCVRARRHIGGHSNIRCPYLQRWTTERIKSHVHLSPHFSDAGLLGPRKAATWPPPFPEPRVPHVCQGGSLTGQRGLQFGDTWTATLMVPVGYFVSAIRGRGGLLPKARVWMREWNSNIVLLFPPSQSLSLLNTGSKSRLALSSGPRGHENKAKKRNNTSNRPMHCEQYNCNEMSSGPYAVPMRLRLNKLYASEKNPCEGLKLEWRAVSVESRTEIEIPTKCRRGFCQSIKVYSWQGHSSCKAKLHTQ